MSANNTSKQNDLRRRLRRLGVTKRQPPNKQRTPIPKAQNLSDAPGAVTFDTPFGEGFAIIHTYSKDYVHGDHPLDTWHEQASDVLAQIGSDSHLDGLDLSQFLFLDTETTGLGGGAMAFQVGVGYFTPDDTYITHQYFLRNPGEESAMLHHLSTLLADYEAVVTFNGRTFDVPLLEGRFIMNRMPPLLGRLPNLDLLGPARRLWRRRLASVALSALEPQVLGVHRTAEDVSGALIPWLYQNYLQTGDASAMFRVLYHNRLDLLSMVTLSTVIHKAFTAPPTHPDDGISLAKWYQQLGKQSDAEQTFYNAATHANDDITLYDALYGLTMLLKRDERRAEACPHWETMAGLKIDVTPHEELAKFYEWHAHDLSQALQWCERALALINTWRRGKRHKKASDAFLHRKQRILSKLMTKD